MTDKTTSVSFGRARLPLALAAQLNGLSPGLRGRTVALILLAHTSGLDLRQLVEAADQLRRLGVLIHQSLRVSGGRGVDLPALLETAKKVDALWP